MVYVDELMNWGWRLGPSCHLFADSPDELHAFAARIGMKRQWAQVGGRSVLHYDLTAGRRAKAVALGATVADRATLRRLLRQATNQKGQG